MSNKLRYVYLLKVYVPQFIYLKETLNMNDTLTFDKNIFSKESILATSYWCADRMITDVTTSDTNIIVALKGRNGFEIDESIIDEFKTMVVHNQIRHQLREKFSELEKAIVEKAFRPVAKE